MNDDLEDDIDDLDPDTFDDFDSGTQTLGDLWRNNPAVKIGTMVAGAVVVLGAIVLLGKGDDTALPSVASRSETVSAAPGTQEVSPAIRDAIEEENEARVEEAFLQGESALPTPIDPPVGRIEAIEDAAAEEDPLQRWRRLQEERLERELQQAETIAPEVDDGAQRAQAVQSLADLMAQQMQAILQAQGEVNVAQRTITDVGYLESLQPEEGVEPAAGGDDDEIIENILVPAGEIAYGQLLIEANSDVPGPVLAQIVSGPLNGSRVLGNFEVQEEYITLNFHTVVVNGISQEVEAVALDPDTSLAGMATEVDHRYFKRIILPAAAAFVEGAASAIAESGLTTITVEGDTVAQETQETNSDQEIAAGVTEAGEELGDILDDIADETKVLVRIEAGTPLGILFLKPVVQEVEEIAEGGI